MFRPLALAVALILQGASAQAATQVSTTLKVGTTVPNTRGDALQVGAFKNEENARRLIGQLNQHGIKSQRIYLVKDTDQDLLKVLIVGFKSDQELLQTAKSLRKAGLPAYRVDGHVPPAPALAAAPPNGVARPVPTPAPSSLLLVLNGQPQKIPFKLKGPSILIPAEYVKELNLKKPLQGFKTIEGKEWYVVEDGVNGEVSVDSNTRAATVVLPPSAFNETKASLDGLASKPTAALPAFTETAVELKLNGQPGVPVLVVFDETGEPLISKEELEALRIKVPVTGGRELDGSIFFKLGEKEGARSGFDAKTQTLVLDLPATAFVEGAYAQPRLSTVPNLTPSDPGGFLNYDLSYGGSKNTQSYGGWAELGLFGRYGVFTQTGSYISRSFSGEFGENNEDISKFNRLDTTWRLDFPEKLTTLKIGDSFSVAGGWGQSVRFGGVQYGTNFNTQPYLVTTPLLAVEGDALVPSTVDVFINNRREATQEVPPGPFTLQNLPAVTGAGQLQIVVTDALGRQQVITQPYYSSTRLLRKGLTEYSAEAGMLRIGYGALEESDRYEDWVGSGTFRRGISDTLTLGAHAEAQQEGPKAAGGEAALKVGTLGVLSGAAAVGGEDTLGWLGSAAFERNGERLSFYGYGQYTTEEFMRVGELDLAYRTKLRTLGTVGYNAWGSTFSLNYLRQSYWGNPTFESYGLGFSKGLGRNGYLSFFAGLTETGSGSPSAQGTLTWSVPFGNNHSASLTAQYNEDQPENEAEGIARLQKNLQPGPGIGYTLEASTSGNFFGSGTLQNKYGSLAASAMRQSEVENWLVSGTGGLSVTSEGLNASRRLEDSFAVAKVGNISGVPVYLNNQSMGRTREDGTVLIERLLPYQENTLRVNATDLPADTVIRAENMTVIPAFRTGVVAKFDLSQGEAVTFRLVSADTLKPLPPGTRIEIEQQNLPVGLDGFVYIERSPARVSGRATWKTGTCLFKFERPEQTKDPLPDLGDVPCALDSNKVDD
jgi:outer membrane usher protein